jgi:hypothetical protein
MENHEHERHIRIHIEQRPCESSNPTICEALYNFGDLHAGFELSRSQKRHGGSGSPGHQRNGPPAGGRTFSQRPAGPNIMFTITYRHGPYANPEGTLIEGGSVKVNDGMSDALEKSYA